MYNKSKMCNSLTRLSANDSSRVHSSIVVLIQIEMKFYMNFSMFFIVCNKMATGLICSAEEERIALDVTQGTPVLIDYIQDESSLTDLFSFTSYINRKPQLPIFMNLNMFNISGRGICGRSKYHVCGNFSAQAIVLSGCDLLKMKRFMLTVLSIEMTAYFLDSKNSSLGFKACKNQSISNDILQTLRNCQQVLNDVKACVDYRKLSKL